MTRDEQLVVHRRLAEVESGGVLNGSHVLVMSLCGRFFGQDLRLLGFSIPALMVRPLGLEPRTVSIRRADMWEILEVRIRAPTVTTRTVRRMTGSLSEL